MATFACISLPPQFITPPPSTSNCNQLNDSDSGSSTGAGGGEMKSHEMSDDGVSTSSQQTPSEYPCPPPPSNSPPESMSSLQAESPIGEDDSQHNVGPGEGTSSNESGSQSEVKVWMAQRGYHSVPISGSLPRQPQSILFVHVNDGEVLPLQRNADGEVIGNLHGPGTVRMIGEPGMTNQPLPIQLRSNQQCHQFVDEEVPQVVGSQHLMNAIGAAPPPHASGPSSTRGGGRGTHSGNGRGNYKNGNQKNGNNENGLSGHSGHSGHSNGHNQGHVGQRNGYSRGNYRGNKFNGRGRGDFHGKPRADHLHANHVTNTAPELADLVINKAAVIDPNAQVMASAHIEMTQMMQPPPVIIKQPQISLLGEPSGPSLKDIQNIVQGIPTPQQITYPPPGIALLMPATPEVSMQDMTVSTPMMNGGMQPPLMKDPMMPGTSVGIAPPMYSVPPPPPGMMIMHTETPFNNNKWIPYQILGENENLLKILAMLRPIRVANTLTTEMEFLYTPLKINDYQFEQGICLFGHIDNSEVTYHATVFDLNGMIVTTVILEMEKCGDDIVSNLFRVQSLHPNTTYKINMKAVIADRGLQGPSTEDLCFRTAPGRPDPPSEVEIVSRGFHFIELAWKTANNNGAFISHYHVYIHEDELEDGRMMQTAEEKILITNLTPQTCYKIRIHSINALGESIEGFEFDAWTKADAAPPAPSNITVYAQSHRSIRVTWDRNPNCLIWIELYSCSNGKGGFARESFSGESTVIGELDPDTEYQLRLIARNEYGDRHSEYINIRTQRFCKNDHPSRFRQFSDEPRKINFDRPASIPFFMRFVDNCPEMGWKNHGASPQELSFLVEGSTLDAPDRYIHLYRGSSTSLIILDSTMHYIRVINIHKKGMRSPPSDRAVIPREYAKYRPEKINDVKLSLANDGCVLVQWKKLNAENDRFPDTARIIYYVQRCDLTENQVLSVGDEDHCVFENIPGETTITVQVRAAVSFHDVLTHGDWSTPSHFTTPRGLPPPVSNAKFDSKTSTLLWDCADLSSDLQFIVTIQQLLEERDFLKFTTKSRSLVLEGVEPGVEYSATLVSLTTVGRSLQNTIVEFSVPALKPSNPVDVTVSHVQIDRCTVSWKTSEPNGARIIGYVVRMMLNGELYRENFVTAIDGEVNCRQVLRDLEPNTTYTIAIAAKNSVGFSEKIEVPVTTSPCAPEVPDIWCDCDSNSLRLHWNNCKSNSNVIYKLMRINKHGQQMSLYEGENNTMKVKNLQENTEYSFKMRVTDRETKASKWSELFSFFTTTAPPPPVKKNPTSSLVQGHSFLYRVEWDDCLPRNSAHKQFYRLQIADATVKGAKWQVAYEGITSSFELNTETFSGALHVRVMCVRKQSDGELKGSPSPVGYIGNIPPTIDLIEDDEIDKSSSFSKLLAGKLTNVSFMFLAVFFLICVMSFSEIFFTWLTGGTVGKVSSGAPLSSSPSPPSAQPPQ